ncbi:unnamed protein product, partial [Gadus morhua 'NCC']
FLQEATDKFSLQAQPLSEGVLALTDASDTEVDADTFDELIKSGVRNFKVGYRKYPVTELDIELVEYNSQSSVLSDSTASPVSLPGPPASPASANSDSTIILPSTKERRKRGLVELERNEARQEVDTILRSNPKGEEIFKEYDKTKTLSDTTRRHMINILVAEMTDSHGRIPPRSVRTSYALGIVNLFPYLQDPYSEHGYEHYYDPEANTGYLAWRLKTVQRNTHDGLQKMRATFEYRQKLVHDQDATSSVFDVFPRFLDIPGLIDQDFSLMFGDEVSGKFLAKWPSYFKPKVIRESQSLPSVFMLRNCGQVATLRLRMIMAGIVICQLSCCCCIFCPLHQEAIRKLSRSAPHRQRTILLDLLSMEPASLHSWRKLMPDSLSSSALDSKRRKSRDSSSLWTTNRSHATP